MRRACLLVAVVAACGGDSEGPAVTTPAECNPLGGIGCITPWPSAVYQADADTATGTRLDFPLGALPTNADGVAIDPRRFHEHDGFSPATFAFTVFPVGVDASSLVGQDELERSLGDDSPTLLVDVDTGERIPHFAELDANAASGVATDQALFVRPMRRLRAGGRYAVGIRKTLRAVDGSALPVPPGFAAIVAGRATDNVRLEAVRGRFDAVFAALETHGVGPDDLVVAWDFDVASDDMLTSDLLVARDRALAFAGDGGANLDFEVETTDVPDDDPRIARYLEGTFQTPFFLTGSGTDARMARDTNGAPELQGTAPARFAAMVPDCPGRTDMPLLLYGHGFFGGLDETTGDYVRSVAQRLCVIVVGTQWRGMSRDDIAGAADAMSDASLLIDFGEQIVQGVVDHLAFARFARGKLANELLSDVADPTQMYFYGISQGHILGSTFLAYEPFIERAALSVGGAGWSLLIERSINWPLLQLFINSAYGGGLNTVILAALLQLGLDRIESLHVSHTLTGTPMPGASRKTLLVQLAVDDSQVTNLASDLQLREMDLPVLAPSARVAYDIGEKDGPLDSAAVYFDEAPTPTPPVSNVIHNRGNGTHGSVRRLPAALRQLESFFAGNPVENPCGGGACSCATGACD